MPKSRESTASAKTVSSGTSVAGYGDNMPTEPSVKRGDTVANITTTSRLSHSADKRGQLGKNDCDALTVPPLCTSYDTLRDRKPDCSYAVLIGIAMRAARAANCGDRLPVVDIYRFIEKEFPYFKKCKSTGWKNCVRHCLSLGQFFCKVERIGEHLGMKGNYWEVIAEKKDVLDRDIELFMIEERKRVIEHTARARLGNRPFLLHSSMQPHDLVRQQANTAHQWCHQELPNINYVIAQPAPPPTAGAESQYSDLRNSSQPTEVLHYPPSASNNVSLPTRQLATPSATSNSAVAHTATNIPEDAVPGEQGSDDEDLKDIPSILALVESVERELKQVACITDHRAKGKSSSEELTLQETCGSSEFNTTKYLGCKIGGMGNSSTDEENPLINPTHPIVTKSTLTSLSSNLPNVAYCTSTKTTITYVTAPTSRPVTVFQSGLAIHPCHTSSYSGHTSTNDTLHPNTTSLHANTALLHPRPPHLPQYLQSTSTGLVFCGRVPPDIAPVITHMHNPSLFLPSSLYYTSPPHCPADCTVQGTSPEQQGMGKKGDVRVSYRVTTPHSQRNKPHQPKGTQCFQQKRRFRGEQKVQGREREGEREKRKDEEVGNVNKEKGSTVGGQECHAKTTVDPPYFDTHYFVTSDGEDLVIAREEEISTSLD